MQGGDWPLRAVTGERSEETVGHLSLWAASWHTHGSFLVCLSPRLVISLFSISKLKSSVFVPPRSEDEHISVLKVDLC